jgi:uncharacterized protein YycO
VPETVFVRDPAATPWPAPGLYFVVKTHGFVPWVIRRATRSPFDHAGVILEDGAIVEAEPGGVRLGHLSEYYGCRIAINSGDEITVQQRAAVVAAARATIGIRYDDLAIADDGLETLGVHWQWLARRAAGNGELICSALVARAGRAAGLDWSCGQPDFEQVTPALLARRPGMQPWTYPAAA